MSTSEPFLPFHDITADHEIGAADPGYGAPVRADRSPPPRRSSSSKSGWPKTVNTTTGSAPGPAHLAGPRRPWGRPVGVVEVKETVKASFAVAAVVLPGRTTRRILGVGWIAHAAYDAVFTHDPAVTRLPTTYAAACAGADIAMGARLILA